MNPFSSESFHLIDFIDESAVINIFYIGSKLENGYFFDDSNIKQSIVWNGVGHRHHSSTVETTIANGKIKDIVVKDQFVVDSELDMGDFDGANEDLDTSNKLMNSKEEK